MFIENGINSRFLLSLVDMPDLQSGVYPIGTDSLSQDESESIFENKTGLAEDLKFLASMPELCDITFLVGETREPVCAVKVNKNDDKQMEIWVDTHTHIGLQSCGWKTLTYFFVYTFNRFLVNKFSQFLF